MKEAELFGVADKYEEHSFLPFGKKNQAQRGLKKTR